MPSAVPLDRRFRILIREVLHSILDSILEAGCPPVVGAVDFFLMTPFLASVIESSAQEPLIIFRLKSSKTDQIGELLSKPLSFLY
jgi:hypothetical protein